MHESVVNYSQGINIMAKNDSSKKKWKNLDKTLIYYEAVVSENIMVQLEKVNLDNDTSPPPKEEPIIFDEPIINPIDESESHDDKSYQSYFMHIMAILILCLILYYIF